MPPALSAKLELKTMGEFHTRVRGQTPMFAR